MQHKLHHLYLFTSQDIKT